MMLKRKVWLCSDDFLSAATGKAFTTVLAGFAATLTSLPNISLLPALVAGFFLVLIITNPGSTNLPALFTCAAPISASASMIFEHSAFFISHAVARASAIPPFARAFPAALGLAFIAFMAFIAFIAFGAAFGAAFMAFIAFIAAITQGKQEGSAK